MKPLIISFFTPDWEYPVHAQRLKKECESMDLDLHLVEMESTGSYRENCCKKPLFILESLEKFQRPLLWLDVDASIIKYPEILLDSSVLSHDIAAVRKKPGLDFWYVNSIWFNHSPKAMKFINFWHHASFRVADDGAFQSVYEEHKNTVSLMELDSSIHMILNRDQSTIGPSICFAHRTSRSASKQREKQASKQISRAKKNANV